MNFLAENKLRLVEAATEANTGDVTTAAVDMQGYLGATFFGTIATANAGNYMYVIQSANANLSSPDVLEGTKVIGLANGNIVAVEVYRPTKRYLAAVVVRTASTALGEIFCVQSGPSVLPVDNVEASEIDSETHVSPAVGSA